MKCLLWLTFDSTAQTRVQGWHHGGSIGGKSLKISKMKEKIENMRYFHALTLLKLAFLSSLGNTCSGRPSIAILALKRP